MPPNSQMSNNSLPKKHHWGYLVSIILLAILFLSSAGFGFWAFTSRQDYKDNVDKKITTAREIEKIQTSTAKDNEFLEKEKLPLKHYQGPAAYGSIDLQYPKTWSAYVVESGQGNTPISGYFHPGFVPNTQGADNKFALRVEVTTTPYDQELKKFESLIKTGKVKVTPYALTKLPEIQGSRINGEITPKKSGSMIIVTMRDKTLKIWTESPEFVGDLDNNILSNFTFIP